MAYSKLEPFGPQALNLNFGILSSVMANVHRAKSQRRRTPQEMALGDFTSSKKQDWRTMLKMMKDVTKEQNLKIAKELKKNG